MDGDSPRRGAPWPTDAVAPRITSRTDANAVLSAVAAAYVTDTPLHCWNAAILESATLALPGVLGGLACVVRLDGAAQLRVDAESVAWLGLSRASSERILGSMAAVRAVPAGRESSASISSMRIAGVLCALGSELPSNALGGYAEQLVRDGVCDDVQVLSLDSDGRGWLLWLALRERHGFAVDGERLFDRIGSSALAGLRLRDQLSPAAAFARDRTSSVEEVRSPSPGPRRTRGVLSGVAGRWTFVRQFEREGDRYVVARAERPRAKSFEALSAAERAIAERAAAGFTTKEIAYALHIADATVRVLLMRAIRKCGLANRRELLELCAARADGEGSCSTKYAIRDDWETYTHEK